MQRVGSGDTDSKSIPFSLVLLLAFAVHGPLLVMKLPLKSYDTNFHIFFASHYVHSWFQPWNTKWYAGFSQTTYPPLPQQWVALLSHLFGLEMAYMVVQFAAILLLTVGVYRFAKLWVDPRAAILAAIASVFLGTECFLVYSAGQLSTTFAAPLYLNALPFLYNWARKGEFGALLKGAALSTAAAAAHHATLLFGSLLFAAPVIALALSDARNDRESESSSAGVITRTVLAVVLIGAAIAVVLAPFWIALIRYPVTQAPIPHPSRANYILSPAWGLNYFIVPYGAMILALPFIVWRGATTPRLRPLLFGFWLAFLFGLGGTTQVGRILLGRAFEVLTMERFTYWASLLALPLVGLLIKEIIERFHRKGVALVGICAVITCAAAVSWSTYKPADAADFKVDSVAAWLNRDGHDNYRYVTLGFGNKIARLAALTNAGSVDGEWNSGRMLPELTQNGAGALTSSKFFGKAGLDALTAILHHADFYGLKWVFVKDPYYEPLLVFAGWRKVDELEDRTISVWGRDDVPPATPLNAPQMPPAWQGIAWGLFPVGSSLLALLLLLIPSRDGEGEMLSEPSVVRDDLVFGRTFS